MTVVVVIVMTGAALGDVCPRCYCAAVGLEAQRAKQCLQPLATIVAHRRIVMGELSGGRSRRAGWPG
jgi:hypothetical protein